ncbi:MAG TPA: chemotaxis protein CheA, partial [Thermoanaerobaculia bacterium]|nr:chemotaxis protein CheA [Thermoanaerobaculia bacterium]
VTLLLESVDAMRSLLADSLDGRQPSVPARLLAALRDAAGSAPSDGEGQGAPLGAAPRAVAHRGGRSLRVGLSKLDRMLDLTSEMAIARGQLRQLVERGESPERVLDALREVDRLGFDVQEAVMNVRLVAVGPSLRPFNRIVRDLAGNHGKRASLTIEGEDVEVDTTVMEHLKDPITHMLRNAVDHGIETPEVRAAHGKPATGRICIGASYDGGGIVIVVSDDGAGLDIARIAARARSLGRDTEGLSRAELFALVLEPGFSTTGTVTDLSGRGVGMDVVRRNVESLRGTIAIDSVEGAGTTITIRLPLTLAVIDGFAVGCGGETFVLPMESVLECLEVPAASGGDGTLGLLTLRGESLPTVRLRGLFGSGSGVPPRENVVVVRHGERRAGLVVDALFGESQTVIKPLGHAFLEVPEVAGASVLGNGRVALILDVPELLRQAEGGAR